MMNGSTATWSKASNKPGLAAQDEQSGLAFPQVVSTQHGAGEVFADTQLDEAF